MNPPIVTIFKNSTGVYASSKFQITEWNIDDLVSLDGMKIFDSEGCFYEVKNVVKKGWAYLWGYNPFYRGRYVKVALTLSEPQKIHIDNFKGILKEQMKSKKNKIRYEKRINEAINFKELIEVFMYDKY